MKCLPETLREENQQADGDDDEQRIRGAGLLELKTANRFPWGDMIPACTDHTDHRRRSERWTQSGTGVGDQERHNLRQDAIKKISILLAPVARDALPPGRAQPASGTAESSLETPVVWMNSAIPPANGPKPTATSRTSIVKTISIDGATGVHRGDASAGISTTARCFPGAHQAKGNRENDGKGRCPRRRSAGDRHFAER